MRVDDLMKLLADAPPDADVCFINFKASGYLRSVEELEVYQNEDPDPAKQWWYVILKAEDVDDEDDV